MALSFGDDACCATGGQNQKHSDQSHRRKRFFEKDHTDDFRKRNDGKLKARRQHHIAVGEGARHGHLCEHCRDANAKQSGPDIHVVHFEAALQDVATGQSPDCSDKREIEHDAKRWLTQATELGDLKEDEGAQSACKKAH